MRLLKFLVIASCIASAAQAQTRPPTSQPGSEDAPMEYKANDMINKGVELLDGKQEERGLTLISSVPPMFPRSKSRFNAYLALGKHYVATRKFDLAAKQFEYLAESEDPDPQAEGLYQTGICF